MAASCDVFRNKAQPDDSEVSGEGKAQPHDGSMAGESVET